MLPSDDVLITGFLNWLKGKYAPTTTRIYGGYLSTLFAAVPPAQRVAPDVIGAVILTFPPTTHATARTAWRRYVEFLEATYCEVLSPLPPPQRARRPRISTAPPVAALVGIDHLLTFIHVDVLAATCWRAVRADGTICVGARAVSPTPTTRAALRALGIWGRPESPDAPLVPVRPGRGPAPRKRLLRWGTFGRVYANDADALPLQRAGAPDRSFPYFDGRLLVVPPTPLVQGDPTGRVSTSTPTSKAGGFLYPLPGDRPPTPENELTEFQRWVRANNEQPGPNWTPIDVAAYWEIKEHKARREGRGPRETPAQKA